MEAARAIKVVDPRTGDIILRGAGASRLSQAMAAGLVADTLKSDVEAVSRENSGLKAALGAARLDARMEARRASELRREKLDGYLREDAVRESRATLREIAWGFAALGTAAGWYTVAAQRGEKQWHDMTTNAGTTDRTRPNGCWRITPEGST